MHNAFPFLDFLTIRIWFCGDMTYSPLKDGWTMTLNSTPGFTDRLQTKVCYRDGTDRQCDRYFLELKFMTKRNNKYLIQVESPPRLTTEIINLVIGIDSLTSLMLFWLCQYWRIVRHHHSPYKLTLNSLIPTFPARMKNIDMRCWFFICHVAPSLSRISSISTKLSPSPPRPCLLSSI